MNADCDGMIDLMKKGVDVNIPLTGSDVKPVARNLTAISWILCDKDFAQHRTHLLKMLIDNKAILNFPRGSGIPSPLFYARKMENIYLIEAKAEVNLSSDRHILHCKSFEDQVFLLLNGSYCECGSSECPSEMIDHLKDRHYVLLKSSLPLPIDCGHHLLHKQTVTYLWRK